MTSPAPAGVLPTERDSRAPRAPSVGLALGGLLIAYVTVASTIAAKSDPSWAMEFAGLGVIFLAPLFARWPLSRRRCAWTAALWFVGGSLIVLPMM